MTHFTPRAFFVCLLATLVCGAALADPYKPDPGPYTVETYTQAWQDTARDREVPVRVFFPVDAQGPRPVVVVSHGLGGTRDALSYLGRHWASYGYVCIHMQHHGSDDAIWRGVPARERMRAMRAATNDLQAAQDRAADVPFVLDTLEAAQEAEDTPRYGQLDLDHIAIAGHSYGAWTCMALAGQGNGLNGEPSFRDERVDVAIPLSSPAPRSEKNYRRAYAGINIPVFHVTGTLDSSPVNDTTAQERRVPYDHSPGCDEGGAAQYLVTFEGGDHMVLGGPPMDDARGRRMMQRMREREGVDTSKDPLFHSLIMQATTAFLDGWLLGDGDALAWLDEGALEESVGDDGVVESK